MGGKITELDIVSALKKTKSTAILTDHYTIMLYLQNLYVK